MSGSDPRPIFDQHVQKGNEMLFPEALARTRMREAEQASQASAG
jgi:hypothetical protein